MGDLARQFASDGITDQKLALLCSMLVTAYPCITCSVHRAKG